MTSKAQESTILIVQGITEDGRKFRPSDWAERMSGMLSTFGKDQRIRYSPMLKPITLNGVKCIEVDSTLENSQPGIYLQVMNFAKLNNLSVIEKTN